MLSHFPADISENFRIRFVETNLKLSVWQVFYDDAFEFNAEDAAPGCLIIRIVDTAGNPLAGATLKKGFANESVEGALYFNADMSGFEDETKTSASGIVILANDSKDGIQYENKTEQCSRVRLASFFHSPTGECGRYAGWTKGRVILRLA